MRKVINQYLFYILTCCCIFISCTANKQGNKIIEKDLKIVADPLDGSNYMTISIYDKDQLVSRLSYQTNKFKDNIAGSAYSDSGVIMGAPDIEQKQYGEFLILPNKGN